MGTTTERVAANSIVEAARKGILLVTCGWQTTPVNGEVIGWLHLLSKVGAPPDAMPIRGQDPSVVYLTRNGITLDVSFEIKHD